jgi:hypothetical protein
VIVDVAADCKTLLDQLLAGDASASERLVQAGAAAVPVLVAAFPGPLEAPAVRRPSSGLPRASECGPILRTLAKLGIASVPFRVVRTNDADPEVRRWATRLLGEIPSAESAHAVARRFFDGDVEVRRSALAAARLFAASADTTATLVAELGMTAEERGKPTGVRLTAMEVLAELRHAAAVPYLVLALSDNPIDIVQGARRALVILSRQDFGTVPAAWSEWWRADARILRNSSGRGRGAESADARVLRLLRRPAAGRAGAGAAQVPAVVGYPRQGALPSMSRSVARYAEPLLNVSACTDAPLDNRRTFVRKASPSCPPTPKWKTRRYAQRTWPFPDASARSQASRPSS